MVEGRTCFGIKRSLPRRCGRAVAGKKVQEKMAAELAQVMENDGAQTGDKTNHRI